MLDVAAPPGATVVVVPIAKVLGGPGTVEAAPVSPLSPLSPFAPGGPGTSAVARDWLISTRPTSTGGADAGDVGCAVSALNSLTMRSPGYEIVTLVIALARTGQGRCR